MARTSIAAWTILGSLVILSTARLSIAADFRVETEVFAEKQPQPVSENLTLFQGAVAYDFELTEPQQTTIFDTTRGQLVMLDAARQVRTTVTTQELLQFVAELKARAGEERSRLKFLANPEFTTTFEPTTSKLTLASDVLTYNAKGTAPKEASAVARYREFADWSARLNSTRPESMLPFSRLALNRSLAEKNLIPNEVELTLTPESRLTGKKITLKSKQTFTWRLLESDGQKIGKAAAQATEFEAVTLTQYRQFDKLAERKK